MNKNPENVTENTPELNVRTLRVWHFSTLGAPVFHIPVSSVLEARKMLNLLAYYDAFMLQNELRGDYSNSGGLEVWNEEDRDWEEWYSEDGEDIWDYTDDDTEDYNFFNDTIAAQVDWKTISELTK